MGCGASKDAASAPGPECCGANSKKKKRSKETEAEAHQEEAESQVLLSSSQKQSEEERFHTELDLRVRVDLEQYVQVQTEVPALPFLIGNLVTSSPRDLLRSSNAPSTVGSESKTPTLSNDFRNLNRTPSPAAAGPAQTVPSSRTASPGQSAPASPRPSASASPGHSTRSISASPHKVPASPGASASPHSVPTSRSASLALSAPPSIPTSRTASPAEPKASKTSSAQPNEDGSRNASPLPAAEFKRTPSAAPSRTPSPRIPDFKGQRGSRNAPPAELKRTPSAAPSETSRTPSPRIPDLCGSRTPPTPAPAAPKSRTPSPAPAQVPESKLELRKPAPLSQEESSKQFSSYPSSPAAEVQESVTASALPRSTTSPPQYTDEQRKQLLADLVEKISRSSSRTSVASLKDSRSSSKSPAPSHHSKAFSNSPAMSSKESRVSSATASNKASTVYVDEDLSAAAAAALQAIVNSVTSGLEPRDEDALYDVEAAESAFEASTKAAPPRDVDEAFREKGAQATELHQNDEQGDEDEDLATPDNLESVLSCVEIKRSQSQTNASADTESTGVPSPRPGLMDYYLGLRSGEYKLSSPSSSASSQNEALADIKSAIDDLDLTKEELAEDSNTTTGLDHVYNEIRMLKFSDYGLQQESNGSTNTGKTEVVTTTTTTTTKVQVLEQVASPLSSKDSVEEGDVFVHKLQSLLTRIT